MNKVPFTFYETGFTKTNFLFSILKQQNEIWNLWKNNGGANAMPYYPPNYAAATASYDPSGFHQTAAIYPPNAVSFILVFKFELRNLYNFDSLLRQEFTKHRHKIRWK